MTAPSEQLRRRVYNVTAMSFTPEELVCELSKYVPDLRVSYRPDSRQDIGINQLRIVFVNNKYLKTTNFSVPSIADSWPQVFDDSEARNDWNWMPKYNLEKLVELMVRDVRQNYIENNYNGNGNGAK